MKDPQDQPDLVDEYINEQLDLKVPIANYIHKILHTKLYQMIRDYPAWLKEKTEDEYEE